MINKMEESKNKKNKLQKAVIIEINKMKDEFDRLDLFKYESNATDFQLSLSTLRNHLVSILSSKNLMFLFEKLEITKKY